MATYDIFTKSVDDFKRKLKLISIAIYDKFCVMKSPRNTAPEDGTVHFYTKLKYAKWSFCKQACVTSTLEGLLWRVIAMKSSRIYDRGDIGFP